MYKKQGSQMKAASKSRNHGFYDRKRVYHIMLLFLVLAVNFDQFHIFTELHTLTQAACSYIKHTINLDSPTERESVTKPSFSNLSTVALM